MDDPLEQLKATLRKPLDTVEAHFSQKDQLRRIVKRALRADIPSSSMIRWIRAKAMDIMVAEAEMTEEELDSIVEDVVSKIVAQLGEGK